MSTPTPGIDNEMKEQINTPNGEINNNILDEIFNIDNCLTMIKIGTDAEKIYFAKEIGKIFKEEKQIMLELQNKKKKREKKIKEIILFFNHNKNILPLTFKSYNRLNDIFNKYKAETNNKYKNLKFVFKIREFTNDDLNLYLGHIKGMVTGEEIIVIG